MKLSRACLLLVAVSALAICAAKALNIDYTITGLTAWNGLLFQDAAFDPTPDHPFRMTFNLNDSPLWGYRFNSSNDQVEFSGMSPTSGPPILSIAGAPPLNVGPPPAFYLPNPATSGGKDLYSLSGGPLFRIFLDFYGPALFHHTNGQATFETGTFDLTGRLNIVNPLVSGVNSTETPLADVVLTAQSVPVPEGASWLLAASAAVGVAGAYGMRRCRLRPVPSTLE